MVPAFAEFGAKMKARMILISIAGIAVPAVVVTVIKHLKNAMMLDHPAHLPANKGTDHLG